MNYLGLLKLLYIADRLALERMEQPITGDRRYIYLSVFRDTKV